MKTNLYKNFGRQTVLLFALFFSSIVFSQTINWSGIINDNAGNPMSDTNVTLTFSILNNANNALYSESKSAQTNSKGFVSAEIGNGTVIQGNFSTLDWSAKYKLKTEINTGNGNIVLGISEMKSVPYANSSMISQGLKKGDAGIFLDEVNDKINFTVNGNQTGSMWGDYGKLQLNYLSGNVNGNLYVDALGTIERKIPVAVTKYLSISGAALVGDNSSFHAQYGAHSTVPGVNRLFSAVNLPENAIIKNMKVVYFDNSTADITVGLYYHNDVSNLSWTIASINTSNSAVWQTANGIADAANSIVNNQNYSYFISVHCTNWEGIAAKAGIRRIVISYEIYE